MQQKEQLQFNKLLELLNRKKRSLLSRKSPQYNSSTVRRDFRLSQRLALMKTISVYTDASIIKNRCASGAWVIDVDGVPIVSDNVNLFACNAPRECVYDSQSAELYTLLLATRASHRRMIKIINGERRAGVARADRATKLNARICLYNDNKYVCRISSSNQRCFSPKFSFMVDMANEIYQIVTLKFKEGSIEWIPRTRNAYAHKLASMFNDRRR